MLKLDVHIFAADPELNRIAGDVARADAMRRSRFTIHENGLEEAQTQFQNGVAPTLSIIEVTQTDPDAALAKLDELAEDTPEFTHVVIAGHIDSARFYHRLTERGVEAYIPLPTTRDEVHATIDSVFSGSDQGRSRLITMFGAKGGVGASTIAQNLAIRLADDDHEVCLVEGDLGFGTIAINFDARLNTGIRSALRHSDTITDKTIDRYLVYHTDNLALLGDLAQLDNEPVLTVERFNNILDVLDRNFEYVVIDLPHEWTELTRELFQISHEVVVIAEPRFTSIQNVQMLADYCQKNRNQRPPRVVLNHVGYYDDAELQPSSFANIFGDEEVITSFSYDKQFIKQDYQGELVADRAKENKKLVSQIDKIAENVAHAEPTGLGKGGRKKKPKSLFKRLLKRAA